MDTFFDKMVRWSPIFIGVLLLASEAAGDTLDIYEAYRAGKIDLEVRGSGIERVRGRVTRKGGTGPMILRIPAGTLFEANSRRVQNMVVTSGTTVNLTSYRSASFVASVACSDLHLSVPGESDQFVVDRLPVSKADLLKFFPVASRVGASYETKQAGVWILTDDANYRALGTLRQGFFIPSLFGNSRDDRPRSISEAQAANAMMLLEKAGIDLTARWIWKDRLDICEAVVGSASTASAWCGKILRETSDSSWKLSALAYTKTSVRQIARNSVLQAKDDDLKNAMIASINRTILPDDSLIIIAQALGNFHEPEIGDALIGVLNHQSAAIKAAAIQSLTRIRERRAPDAVRSLAQAPDEKPAVRLAAIRCLGALGSSDQDLQQLEILSKDDSPQIRGASVLAIQQIRRRPRTIQ